MMKLSTKNNSTLEIPWVELLFYGKSGVLLCRNGPMKDAPALVEV